MVTIRKMREADLDAAWAVVNAAAVAYRGVIPADLWHEPYMPLKGVGSKLLRRYWSIPPRQVETSVVLADARWMKTRTHGFAGA